MKQIAVRDMNAEELAALNDWATAMRQAMPAMQGMAASARSIRDRMIESPQWQILEGRQPTDETIKPGDPWRTGAPKINYVDHIETQGDSSGSPDLEGA